MPGPEQKSTCPPRPPVARCLRESFVSLFQLPDQEGAVRLLDELAYHLTLEGRDHLEPEEHQPGTLDPLVLESIRAAAGDLRQAADQLKESTQWLAERGSEDREVLRIALAIADASAEMQPIADRLDAALTRFLAPPPEE